MHKPTNVRTQITEYNVHRNAWAIGSIAFLLLSAITLLLIDVLPLEIISALLILFVAAMFFCAFKIKPHANSILMVENNDKTVPANPLKANLPNEYELYDIRNVAIDADNIDCDSAYITSNKINTMLSTKTIFLEYSPECFLLPDNMLPYIYYLKNERDKHISHFNAARENKEVTRLSTDLTLSLFESEQPTLNIERTTRYAVNVTNDAFGTIIHNKSKDKNDCILFDGHNLAIDSNGHLRSLSDSPLANEFDIRALMISSDGYAMIAEGTSDHPLYQNMLVPSASCSLLPNEIDSDGILSQSMKRSIDNKIQSMFANHVSLSDDIIVCGFARLMSHGGSPEFYCIVYSNNNAEEIISSNCDKTLTFDKNNVKPILENKSTLPQICDLPNNARVSLSFSAMMHCIKQPSNSIKETEKVDD